MSGAVEFVAVVCEHALRKIDKLEGKARSLEKRVGQHRDGHQFLHDSDFAADGRVQAIRAVREFVLDEYRETPANGVGLDLLARARSVVLDRLLDNERWLHELERLDVQLNADLLW